MGAQIEYIKVGGSYQLTRDYRIRVALRPATDIVVPRLRLRSDGWLTISAGYCWDGTSGPVIDRRSNMRAGLVHDALYELMRKKVVHFARWREADAEFAKILREDKAWPVVIKIDLAGLRIANGKHAHPSKRKKRFTAP